MHDTQVQIIDLFNRMHLFRGLEEGAIRDIASQFRLRHVDEGTLLIEEDDEGDVFFIVFKGRVIVTREDEDGEEIKLAHLVTGDYFGEEALLYDRPRTANVKADTHADVLYIEEDEFLEILEEYPQIRSRVETTIASRRKSRRLMFKWLAEDEVVYLVTGKHPAMLWSGLIGPVFVGVFAIPLIFLTYLTQIYTPLVFGLIILAAAIAWGLWKGIDWGNDYYIITNKRVVWLEKVIALYDSREEAPLGTILSVGIGTDQLGRILGYGNVIVRTYTGHITMRGVGKPEQIQYLVEEYWQRTKQVTARSESDAMEFALRKQLGLPTPEEEAPDVTPEWAKDLTEEPTPLQIMFSSFFKLRYEDGGTIIYRKHWWVLITTTWAPGISLLALLLLFAARMLFGFLGFISSMSMLVFTIAVGAILFAWWLYKYVDWRNDMYQITTDHIIDIERTPLGAEERKSAPLENILSLNQNRTGILGLLLNFGTVRASVGTAVFDFENIFDPAQVQQDIFNRMSIRIATKRKAEADRERERMAEWLATYHRHSEVYREEEGTRDGLPDEPDIDNNET